MLTLLDEDNRQALDVTIGVSLTSPRVVQILDELVAVHGARSAAHTFSPASLIRTPEIERFNRSYRTEVLNVYVRELQALSSSWLQVQQARAPAR